MAKQNKIITIRVDLWQFEQEFEVVVEDNILFNGNDLYPAESCSSYLTVVQIVAELVDAIMREFDGIPINIKYLARSGKRI